MKSIAFTIAFIGTMFLTGIGIVLGMGMGAGLVLHWFVPSVDLSAAAICGTVATGFGIAFCAAIMILMSKLMAQAPSMDTDDEDDSDLMSEDQVDEIADRLTEAFLLRMALPNSRSKPKSNRTR